MASPTAPSKKYRVPRGHVLVRPDPTLEVKGGLHIPVAAQGREDEPPTGEVVMHYLSPEFFRPGPVGVFPDIIDRDFTDPVYATEGDRVHYKPHCGVPMTLLLDSSPYVARCVRCQSAMDAPDLLPMCPKHKDAATGQPQPHEFGVGVQEPEGLLVLDLRDVILVEVQDVMPDLPGTLGEPLEASAVL